VRTSWASKRGEVSWEVYQLYITTSGNNLLVNRTASRKSLYLLGYLRDAWMMALTPPRGHKYVPWRRVDSWACIRCGDCCRRFLVTLTPGEAYNLTRKYGIYVVQRGTKYVMPCKADGSCIFLEESEGGCWCAIYFERPYVCRMYPFHVSRRDLGGGDEALYVDRDGEKFYVYVDTTCRGVGRGAPIASRVPIVVSLWRKVVGV